MSSTTLVGIKISRNKGEIAVGGGVRPAVGHQVQRYESRIGQQLKFSVRFYKRKLILYCILMIDNML